VRETHLKAMLSTINTAPGLCTHIMGMLIAPTSLMRYVLRSWGRYWITARPADVTPRNVAQIWICRGGEWKMSKKSVTKVSNALGNERGVR
jgi:hypothetical protein